MNKSISARAKRVWQRLIDWYGSARITEAYGPTPPPDWAEQVDSADNEQVRRALSTIRAKYVAHPPTFPQFAEALAPTRQAQGPAPPSVATQLVEHVLRECRLTPAQLRGPWTYLGKMFAAQDLGGKMTENHGADITGVVIDPDGDSTGYRVMLADISPLGTQGYRGTP